MKTDQKAAQPAPSPQAGEIVFPVEQAGPEEKGYTEGGWKEDAVFALPALRSAHTPGGRAAHLRLQPPPCSGSLAMSRRETSALAPLSLALLS